MCRQFQSLAFIFLLTGLGAAHSATVREEEIVVIGTRSSKDRSVVDATAPIDIIGSEELSSVGGDDNLVDSLDALVPSYQATPAFGDGSSFVRPTSMRGMAADQTLVMVNGKRRHRSSLLFLFAPSSTLGAHAPDIGMIPAIALKKVEILRDGASAQYGSDAIAGVMNFALKDSDEGGTLAMGYGQHYEGEKNWRLSGNVGTKLCKDGFLNFSMDTNKMDHLSRGNQHPRAKILIEGGVQGVGADSINDNKFVQTWGRPEERAVRMVFNVGCKVGKSDFYAFANYASTQGKWSFFYRHPAHTAMCATANADGVNCDTFHPAVDAATNLEREKRAGFTPLLSGKQSDYGITVGLKGEGLMGLDSTWDFSVTKGDNHMDYTLMNSLNPYIALEESKMGRDDADDKLATRDFDTTDLRQQEMIANADFSMDLSSTLFLAYGLEFREEEHTQYPGSWGARFSGGVSGMAGNKLKDAGEHDRSSYAAYVDMEKELSDRLLTQAALRFENYSDFGNTLTGKLAGRYNLSPTIGLRGALSTGFKAPTPGQANLRTTVTDFQNRDGSPGAETVYVNHVPPTHAAAKALGGKELTDEKSLNISLGTTWRLARTLGMTLDVYRIKLKDRIYRNTVRDTTDADGDNIYQDYSFYTNALDTTHTGLDLVLSADIASLATQLTFAFNYNKIEVSGRKKINGVQVVGDDVAEDVEKNYPQMKFTLSANTALTDTMGLMSRVRFWGSHYDDLGTVKGDADGNSKSTKISPVFYLDLEYNWQMKKDLNLVAGISNVLDTFPTKVKGDDYAGYHTSGFDYAQFSAAGYEGGSWYVKGVYTF